MKEGLPRKYKITLCEFCKIKKATTKLALDEDEVYNSCEECKENIFETIRDNADSTGVE